MRVVKGRGCPNAHELRGADLDHRHTRIVMKMRYDLLSHDDPPVRAASSAECARLRYSQSGGGLFRRACGRRSQTSRLEIRNPIFLTMPCHVPLPVEFAHVGRNTRPHRRTVVTKIPLVSSLVVALGLAAAAWSTIPRGIDAGLLLAGQEDPARLADLALDKSFDAAAAQGEIEAALAGGDAELAQSFLELARDRRIPVDDALVDKVDAARRHATSPGNVAVSFVHGLITGAPDDPAGFAGTALGDLFVFGDVRDSLREGMRILQGEEADKVVLGLSAAGIALTAGTYLSAGAAAPARVGLSLLKAVGKSEGAGMRLARIANFGKIEDVVRVAGDVGRAQAKAGTRAVVEGIKLVQGPKDVKRLARLAEAKGGKTRAIVKFLGRGAIALTVAAFDLALWVFWAVLSLFGFVAAMRRSVERLACAYFARRRRARTHATAMASA
jgi:hypothetical protein